MGGIPQMTRAKTKEVPKRLTPSELDALQKQGKAIERMQTLAASGFAFTFCSDGETPPHTKYYVIASGGGHHGAGEPCDNLAAALDSCLATFPKKEREAK